VTQKERISVDFLLRCQLPSLAAQLNNFTTSVKEQTSDAFSILRDVARFASIGVAVTLIAYLVSRKIQTRRRNKANKTAQ